MAYSRKQAAQIIGRVLDGTSLQTSLPRSLVGGERAWMSDVVSGTLRYLGRVDFLMNTFSKREPPRGQLRDILRVAAYQVVAQKKESIARTVYEVVEEVKKTQGAKPAGFANALLREMLRWREGNDFPRAPRRLKNIYDRAAWNSLSVWMQEHLEKSYGEEWVTKFAEASLERPEVWLRLYPGAERPKGLIESEVSGAFRKEDRGRLDFGNENFFVQNISSQKIIQEVAALCLRGFEGRPSALDLCAAPGGKSIGLAWEGCDVTATDFKNRRLETLERSIARVRDRERIRILGYSDATASLKNGYDLVWVDAPCTGTGTLRQNPEIRWTRTEKNLGDLVDIQRSLILQAWDGVRPGGWLVYSVCSVFQEEGKAHFQKDKIDSPERREWWISPQDDPGADGFWAIALQK